MAEKEPTTEDSWHLFNDFLVRKISKEDALKFAPSWKLPSVLAYQISTARHVVDDSWKSNLDTTLLYRDFSIKFVCCCNLFIRLLSIPAIGHQSAAVY